jgi:hypothetical protein
MRRRRFLALFLLLFFLAGCGREGQLSASVYKEEIAGIHDGVAYELGYALQDLASPDYDDYFYLVRLGEAFREAEAIFAGALREAEGLPPPEKWESLHGKLIDYYREGEREAADMAAATEFFEVVYPILGDVRNLAFPRLSPQADAALVAAAADEDHLTLDGYVGELEGIDPPEGLEDYRDRLAEALRSLYLRIGETAAEVKPGEYSALEAFASDWEDFSAEIDSLWEEAQGYLEGMGERVDRLLDRGEELAEEIHKL